MIAKRDRAEYMREYRKQRTAGLLVKGADRILALEAEVARLKLELAARPTGPSFNSRPFTPAPKK